MVKRVLLASPRGYCAGVERAVETVEQALELYGAPVYVRKQIVHNAHVVRDLERRGAVFVESEDEAPEGATLVLSAHGVAPVVHERAAARRLTTIDAACPLVTKVHAQVKRWAEGGHTVVLIGHAGLGSALGRKCLPHAYELQHRIVCHRTAPPEPVIASIASSQRAGFPMRIALATVSGCSTGAPRTNGAAPAAWKPSIRGRAPASLNPRQ